jgi:uncharacterized protein (UPF0332 family)
VTGENKRRNISDEVARADQALRASRALLELGLCADAVSRSYYAVFHLVRALLLTRGVETKTHAGAIHLLNTEFIRRGLLPSSHNRLLAGLQRSRELADYDAAVTFSADDAAAELSDAERFVADALALLQKEGWTAGGHEE